MREEAWETIRGVRDERSHPRERLNQARVLLWQLERDWTLDERGLLLGRLVVSRWLDDASASVADDELVRAWREHALTDDPLLANANALTVRQALIVANLLFDRGEHPMAVPYYARALSSHSIDAPNALLAAYNYEICARENDDLASVEAALVILEQPRTAEFSGTGPLAVEAQHCRGHLYLHRNRLVGPGNRGFARHGIELLREASELDPSYTSCYTSAFAEDGNYVGTVEASLEALRRRHFEALPVAAARTVGIEVLFYLGHAYLCLGEYELSRVCFSAFVDEAELLRQPEARDHGRLFKTKLDLKRRMTVEVTADQLGGYLRELRSLSFRSPLSAPVGEEAVRYDKVVEFLRALVSARRRPLNDFGRDSNRAALAPVVMAEPLGPDFFASARVRADDTLRALVGRPVSRRELASGVILLGSEMQAATWSLIEGRLQEFATQWTVRRVVGAGLLAQLAAVVSDADVVGVAGLDAESTRLLRELPLAGRCLIVLADEELPGHLAVPDPAAFSDMLTIGLALVAAKRFLLDDDYVFGIVPCIESPATRYQHPEYILSDTRSTEVY